MDTLDRLGPEVIFKPFMKANTLAYKCPCHIAGLHILLGGSVEVGSVVNVIEGNTLDLSCIYPGAEVWWTKAEDPNFAFNNPNLTIVNLQRVHAGTYTCTAVLSTNKETGINVDVNVLCKI